MEYTSRFGPNLTIKVKWENSVLTSLRMFPDTRFSEVLQRLNRVYKDCYLLVDKDYTYINDYDTPESLGLESGDVVRYVEGGCARVYLSFKE